MKNISIEVETEPDRLYLLVDIPEMIRKYREDHPENLKLAEQRLKPWLTILSIILFFFFSFIFYKAVKISDEILYGQLPDENKVRF